MQGNECNMKGTWKAMNAKRKAMKGNEHKKWHLLTLDMGCFHTISHPQKNWKNNISCPQGVHHLRNDKNKNDKVILGHLKRCRIFVQPHVPNFSCQGAASSWQHALSQFTFSRWLKFLVWVFFGVVTRKRPVVQIMQFQPVAAVKMILEGDRVNQKSVGTLIHHGEGCCDDWPVGMPASCIWYGFYSGRKEGFVTFTGSASRWVRLNWNAVALTTNHVLGKKTTAKSAALALSTPFCWSECVPPSFRLDKFGVWTCPPGF